VRIYKLMKIYIIDLYSVIFKSYYAIRNLTSSNDFPTGAIFGTIKTIIKIIKNFNAENIIIVADSGKKTFRNEIYNEYKANRLEAPDDLKLQFPVIKELITKMDFCLLEKENYEADDLIFSLTEDFSKNNDELFIYTSDKDLYQLTTEKVKIINESKQHGTVIAGPEETYKKFGVRSEQILDYLALVGDKSDNIPGVKGIGKKTAAQLLSDYKNIDLIYSNIEKIKSESLKKKLIDGKENAYLSKELATLKYVDLTDIISNKKIKNFDLSKGIDILKKYDLNSVIKEIGTNENYDLFNIFQAPKPNEDFLKDFNPKTYDLDDLKNNIDLFDYSKKVLFYSVEIRKEEYIIISNFKDYIIFKYTSEDKGINELIKKIILKTEKHIFYSFKDFIKKYSNDFELSELEKIMTQSFDIAICSYLIDSDEINISIERLINKYKNKNHFFDVKNKKIPYTKIIKYYQFIITEMFDIDEVLFAEIEKLNLQKVYNDIEIPLSIVLLKMELFGIKIDKEYLNDLHIKLNDAMNELAEKIIDYTGSNVNINSTKQLSEILFDKLGLPPVKKIKTGYSTDTEVLEKLSDIHPLPKLILEYRTLTKLINTYTSSYLKLEKDNRIYTTFNQCITTTGRLSSSEPNMQNIPVESEDNYSIRRIFIADEGCLLVSADYSQIELRLLAHLSGDENMIEAFNNDEDIHTKTAKEIFGTLLPVDKQQRRIAKTVNFAIIYGMGAFSLSKDLNIRRKDAEKYIQTYFERYPKIREYLDSIILFARENGYVETMFGRKRFIKKINDKNKNVRSSAERMAINMPVQGTAADIMKYAMINVFNQLKDYKTEMCLTVHDEIVFNVVKEEIETIKKIIDTGMAKIVSLKVPLKVDIKIGNNWSE
jgi:DNA polymerase I